MKLAVTRLRWIACRTREGKVDFDREDESGYEFL